MRGLLRANLAWAHILLLSSSRVILLRTSKLPLQRLALQGFNLVCNRNLRLLVVNSSLLYKVYFWFIIGLESGMSSVVVRRGRGMLLLRRPWTVKDTSFGQGGLHRVEVSQSQWLLLLLTWDKICWCRFEAGLGLRVHIRRRRWSCLPKVLSMVLSWDSLVRLNLYLLSISMWTHLRRLVQFVIGNSTQFCCLPGRLRRWYDWYSRFWTISNIVLEFGGRFLLLKIAFNKILMKCYI